LLVASIAIAVADWVAVALANRPVEYATKVGVMLGLIAFAVALHPASSAQRILFVIALGLGLVSDVFLMLPRDLFLPGLVAALVEHVFYIAGFRVRDFDVVWFAGAALVAVLSAIAFLPPILRALRKAHASLVIPVIVYVAIFGFMVASAGGTRSLVAVAGALLFFYSDAILAWNRFVRPIRYGRVVNLVPYHLGQAVLVLSLLA